MTKHLTLLFLIFPISTQAQKLTGEAFSAALSEATWESSYTNYSRFKFGEAKTDILTEKGEVSRSWKTEILEPGLIRGTFKNDRTIWFSFDDEAETFCSPNLLRDWAKHYTFTIEGGEVEQWPGLATTPDRVVTVKLSGHDQWQAVKLGSQSATPVLSDGSEGEPFPVQRFHSHASIALTNIPDQKSAGCFILSRSGDKGWFTEGSSIGNGAKTFRNRIATAKRSSPNTGFTRRTNQFAFYFLKMNKMEQAYAHEHYAEYYMLNHYGEDSAKTIAGLRVIGELRASSLKYSMGPYWLKKAVALGKNHYRDDPRELLELEVGLAYKQYQAGQYAEAMQTLKDMAEQPDLNERFDLCEYRYVMTIASEAFARGDFEKAAVWMGKMAEHSETFKKTGWVVVGKLGEVAALLAKGDKEGALAALNEAVAVQEARQQRNPKSSYSTQDLSFASNVLGQWENAETFSRKGNYKSSYFAFEEIARLTALWNQGKEEEATAFAREIHDRFDNDMSGVWRATEEDETYIALIEVLSDPGSAEKIKAFREVWEGQKQFFKQRPLKNYLFFQVVNQVDRLLGP